MTVMTHWVLHLHAVRGMQLTQTACRQLLSLWTVDKALLPCCRDTPLCVLDHCSHAVIVTGSDRVPQCDSGAAVTWWWAFQMLP